MKFLKRLAVVLSALIMAFSVMLVAACDLPGFETPDGGTEKTDPDNGGGDNTGSGDNTGNGDNTGTGGNTGSGEEEKPITKKQLVQSVLDDLEKSHLDYMTGEFVLDMTDDKTSTEVTYAGDVETGRTTKKSSHTDVLSGTAKFNAEDGNADVVTKEHGETTQTDGSKDKYAYKYYSFLRGWHSYLWQGDYDEEKDVTDFSDKGKEIEDYGSEEDLGLAFPLATVSKYPQRHIYTLTMLAKEASELEDATAYILQADEKTGDIVLDVNASVYWFKKAVDLLLENIKETDTLKSVLTDPLMTNYIKAIVNIVDPEDLPKVPDWINRSCINADPDSGFDEITAAIFSEEPDEGSTSYEYLLKLLDSEKVYSETDKVLKQFHGVNMPAKLGDVTLKFIIETLFGYEFQDIISEAKSAINDYYFTNASEKSFTVRMGEYDDMVISDMKVVLHTLNGKVVSEQVKAKATLSFKSENSDKTEDGEIKRIESEVTVYDFSGTVNFTDAPYSVPELPEDIGYVPDIPEEKK